MRRPALLLAALAIGCAAFDPVTDGAERVTTGHDPRPGEVPGPQGLVWLPTTETHWEGGKALRVNARDHRLYWVTDEYRWRGRLARSCRIPEAGETVTLVTPRGETEGRVLAVLGDRWVGAFDRRAFPGDSGSGAWLDRETVAGVLLGALEGDPRIMRFAVPREEGR